VAAGAEGLYRPAAPARAYKNEQAARWGTERLDQGEGGPIRSVAGRLSLGEPAHIRRVLLGELRRGFWGEPIDHNQKQAACRSRTENWPPSPNIQSRQQFRDEVRLLPKCRFSAEL
jgi:hypothetical protein